MVGTTSAKQRFLHKIDVLCVHLSGFGFIGLFILKQIQNYLDMTERQFMDTTGGAIATWTFVGMFSTGFLLGMLSIPLQRFLGEPISGPVVPKWISYPILGILFLLLAFFALFIIGLTVDLIFDGGG